MASSSIQSILLRTRVAQRMGSRAYLNEYSCGKCGSCRVLTPSNARNHPLCRNCAKPNRKHGMASNGLIHPLYSVWANMKERCGNPKNISYAYYGGRGISVCADWNEFIPFYDWAVSNGWKDGLRIDRIDASRGYMPTNCRFVTPKVNSRRTSRVKLTIGDARAIRMLKWSGMPVRLISPVFGISEATVYYVCAFKAWNEGPE